MPPLSPLEQARLRLNVFAELERLIDTRGGFATRDELVYFQIEGRQFGLIDYSRGIRNPTELDSTLSVVSSSDGPYDDHVGDDGILRYAFRAGDPEGGDNRKLRAAMTSQTPIILFEKPLPNVYVPILPAFVIDEDRDARFFLIATDEAVWRTYAAGTINALDKKYVEQIVRRRVHQPVFRAMVMVAYSKTCAVCRLKHPELLDAAHIIPDSEESGVAAVPNGMALCKLHHAAFDQRLLGVSADFIVHIDKNLMKEVDGPMLRHGLQDMHGVKLTLPRRLVDWPSKDALDLRFQSFGT